MTDKNAPLKKETISNDITLLVDKKIGFFKDVIQKTIIHVQKNKFLDILGIGDVGTCIDRLGDLNRKIHDVANNKNNTDNLINNLQVINNELSGLLKNYGTDSLEDLLLICFGNNNKLTADDGEQDKLDLLKKYFHPSSYKVINRPDDTKQKKNDEFTDEMRNLTCIDTGSSYKQFNMKVFGIKLLIRNVALKKSLLIYGVVDDVVIDFLDSPVETPLIDLGRLYLDLSLGWWNSSNRINEFSDHVLFLKASTESIVTENKIDFKVLNLFSFLAVLRVMPYTKNPIRLGYLKSYFHDKMDL
jgi:hypothetical protein